MGITKYDNSRFRKTAKCVGISRYLRLEANDISGTHLSSGSRCRRILRPETLVPSNTLEQCSCISFRLVLYNFFLGISCDGDIREHANLKVDGV